MSPTRGIEVICADGVRRHPHPFADIAEAAQFMEWGHGCMIEHTVRPVTTPTNPTPRAVVDHDRREVAVLVTLGWADGWAMDGCEISAVVGDVRRAVAGYFVGSETVTSIQRVETWEPNEETHFGIQRGSEMIRQPNPSTCSRCHGSGLLT